MFISPILILRYLRYLSLLLLTVKLCLKITLAKANPRILSDSLRVNGYHQKVYGLNALNARNLSESFIKFKFCTVLFKIFEIYHGFFRMYFQRWLFGGISHHKKKSLSRGLKIPRYPKDKRSKKNSKFFLIFLKVFLISVENFSNFRWNFWQEMFSGFSGFCTRDYLEVFMSRSRSPGFRDFQLGIFLPF